MTDIRALIAHPQSGGATGSPSTNTSETPFKTVEELAVDSVQTIVALCHDLQEWWEDIRKKRLVELNTHFGDRDYSSIIGVIASYDCVIVVTISVCSKLYLYLPDSLGAIAFVCTATERCKNPVHTTASKMFGYTDWFRRPTDLAYPDRIGFLPLCHPGQILLSLPPPGEQLFRVQSSGLQADLVEQPKVGPYSLVCDEKISSSFNESDMKRLKKVQGPSRL